MSIEKPISDEFHDLMNDLAKALDGAFNDEDGPKKVGFVLLCFPFGNVKGNRINYISNTNRSDVISSLKELVAKFTANQRN